MAVHPQAGFFLCGVHIFSGNIAEIWDVPDIEANSFAHAHIQWHFIDRLSMGVDMKECVKMGPHVIEHSNEICLERHRVVRRSKFEGLGRFMGKVVRNYWSLEEFVSWHIVF